VISRYGCTHRRPPLLLLLLPSSAWECARASLAHNEFLREPTNRALQPENLLLSNHTNEADVVVTDFGLSAIKRPGQVINRAVGTPGYALLSLSLSLSLSLPPRYGAHL